jgi:hypothetical protein
VRPGLLEVAQVLAVPLAPAFTMGPIPSEINKDQQKQMNEVTTKI